MEQRKVHGEAVRAAVGGVLAVEVVNLLLNPPSPEEPVDLVSILVLACVGAIIGWMYELARSTTYMLKESMAQLDAVSSKLQYQEEALSMLLKCPRHGEALSALVSDSIGKNFRYIPFVDENRYLYYLTKAIEHSDLYQGVQRNPVRWFENDKGQYLERLRDKRMKAKIRLFVIDAEDEQTMREDLADVATMQAYWEQTGSDVRTFWIRTSDFHADFRGLPVPADFALYDEQLLVAYDAEREMIQFDLIEPGSIYLELFRKLKEQLDVESSSPFVEIMPIGRFSTGSRGRLAI